MRKALIAVLCLCTALAFPVWGYAANDPVISDGIHIQGIDVGGMTREEAIDALDSQFQSFADTPYSITCADGTVVSVPLSDWDFKWDSASVVDQALLYSDGGMLVRRYKYNQNLERCGMYLQVPFSISKDKLRKTIKKTLKSHDVEPSNAVVEKNGDSFVITTPEQNGLVTDAENTFFCIMDTLSIAVTTNSAFLMNSEVTTNSVTPTATSEELSSITDVLGTFTTSYKGSTENRKTNISIAAKNLNGTVLLPGESLSTSEAIKERTIENGYTMAAAYSNGESEEDIGGGVCQVSTTLYNALLLAELQIDERHNHSLIVHYVDYAADAAIANSRKDLVFTNNLEHPVYIEAKATGKNLTISIFGKETRPENRTIEYVSQTVVERYPDKDDYNEEETDTLPVGTTKITGTRRPEVHARLVKIVKVDGVQTEKKILHADVYKATKQTKLIGTGEKKSKKKKK